MMRGGKWRALVAALAMANAMALFAPGTAHAVPSFARQTGLACEACHTVFPELTPFGRRFKINGYTIDNLPQVSGMSQTKDQTLLLNQVPPLSFMFQASYTDLNKAVPDPNAGGTNVNGNPVPDDALAKNGDILFPQQASLFYAGRVAPNLGAFVQMTYDGTTGQFGWDNTDIRYARILNPNVSWGISLNNNPTVQDLWNSTPAWQSPFDQLSSTAPAPGASTIIDGGLADAGVAGGSVYGYFYNSIYAEIGGYRSAQAAAQIDSNSSDVVKGTAPYWRLAYERQSDRHSWEVGTYGVQAKISPGDGSLSGPTNDYRDWAFDFQYQYIGDANMVTVTTTYIDEQQTLNATYPTGAVGKSQYLHTFKIGTSYFYERAYGAAVGYFSTTGSSDALLYPSGVPLDGFAHDSPDTEGWIGELDWLPYQNTKIAVQFTAYTKFNGGNSDYDGNGRSASDNDTLYILGWINF
jgi:hypothetical protein